MAAIRAKTVERVMRSLVFACAVLSIATTAAIIWILVYESAIFFREVSPISFFFGTRWAPLLEPRSFGVLPLVGGTFLVAGGALLLAVPIGVGSAIYLSEHARPGVRAWVKPVLEVLAGIPSVVYGYFALTFVTPHLLRPLFPDVEIYNAASAAIVVAVMIIPTIASLCDDSFRAVPRSLREAGHALSATQLEVSTRIVLPAALSGVVAATLLALARAIGETMAVMLAAGMTSNFTLNPFRSVMTLTSYIAQVSLGDTPAGSVEYQTIFAVGMTLFLITFAINLVARLVMARFREAYE
ncbi:MAG: phosphate ABC transporter permease subunit PstC [Phycisphaerales bacterium]|nr:phosphate ABC transporter permease subunit PstC [Phycisphaerales bacterium]